MQKQYLIGPDRPQVPLYHAQEMAQGLTEDLAHFLWPLLVTLDAVLDKRLVRTFVQTIAVILTFRDRVNGLVLSELGGYLESPDKAPAGTKRLSNLLHSVKWSCLSHQSLFVAASNPATGEVAASGTARLSDLG